MLKPLRKPRPALAIGVAALVIVQMIMALAMAVSPELHEHFHHDAGDSHHECAVTHLIQGDFGDGAPLPLISTSSAPAIPGAEIVATASAAALASPWLTNGILVHAPPR
ncbi:MAG: hypothetical protein JWO94_4021 [Verrucomicrobiaceae bacterium]|nr:hypothetical protein [Verrucomicrobiaceae bacterium]